MVLKRKKDYIGKTVRTLAKLNNQLVEIPKGTICEVIAVYGGATLKTEKCNHCNVKVIISRVPYFRFEILEEPKTPTLIEKRLKNI